MSIINAQVGFDFRYFYLLGKCGVFFVAAYEFGKHGLDLSRINILIYIATVVACLSVIGLFMSGGISAGERYNFDQDSFSAVGLAINYSAVFLLMLFAAIRGVGLGAFIAFIASMTSACIVVFTASRGAIIAAGVSALLLSIINYRRVSGCQAVIIFLGSIFVYVGTPLKNQLQYVFKRFTYSEGQLGGFSSGRDTILANYYHSWMDTARSVMFGIADYDVGHYPHNIVIEILIRFGAFGAGLSFLFLLLFALDFYRNRCEIISSSLGQLLCVLFFYSLVLSMFNSSLEQNFILFFSVGGLAGLFDANASGDIKDVKSPHCSRVV
ncbi:O-antigen ligase family protein [Thalassobacterium maritimum]|uniref:O-antigen ligase family protein n=1 Tax=Thalassobacterium maritimum TaxID=3041265 RepID=UPI00281114C6|nr:O-antigen ligase family protein [Coraliomargarita sp. SDUM461003]